MTAPLDSNPVDLLKNPPALKQKLSLAGGSAEMRALEQTLALLNNPAVTGAVVPEEERKKPASAIPTPPEALDRHGATIPPADPLFTTSPTTPQPPPAPTPRESSPVPRLLIMLTGRSGAGKNFVASRLNATVIEPGDFIYQWAKENYPSATPEYLESLVQTVKAWGNGEISERYPVTPARVVFDRLAKELWPGYGKPGFFMQSFLQQVQNTKGQVVVTQIDNLEDYKALVGLGFAHFHVVCSSNSYTARPKRKGANDGLAAAFDQDVTRKISAEREGKRLRCVWSDVVAPPSPRLLSIDQFCQEVAIESLPVVETGE